MRKTFFSLQSRVDGMVATIFLTELRKVSSLWQRTLSSFKEAPLSISTGSMNGLGGNHKFCYGIHISQTCGVGVEGTNTNDLIVA